MTKDKMNIEYRNLGSVEISKGNIVTGYASTFDRYKLMEIDGVPYYEQISKDAFKNADMSDVVFLRDHTGTVLARTKNGSVQLWADNHGLAHRTDLGLTAAAKLMYEDIKAGNYSQMSFSFVVDEDHFDNKTNTRIIDSIKKVYDISAVAFPANPYTAISLDSRNHKARLQDEEQRRKALILRIKILKSLNGM